MKLALLASAAVAVLLARPALAQMPPVNDDCEDATFLSTPGTVTGTLLNASDPFPPDGITPDVWYRHTATGPGVLRISTCGTDSLSGTDTMIRVQGASCVGGSIVTSTNAPTMCSGASPLDAEVVLSVDGGETFLIAVAVQSGSPAVGEFELTIELTPPPPSVCNGDGGDQMGCTDCPCGNDALPGTVGGCLNATNGSARLFASGSLSVQPPDSFGDIAFSVENATQGGFGILISGSALAPVSAADPCFGLGSGVSGGGVLDGLRCAGGAILRHGGRQAAFDGSFGIISSGWGGADGPAGSIAAAAGFVAGETRYFQVVYRTNPALGCGTGQNSTQAIEVTFEP